MKAILLTGLSAIALAAAAVEARSVSTVSSEIDSSSGLRLIGTNQSQVVETLSMADGFSRLPASAYKIAGVYFITSNKGQVFGSESMNNQFDDPTGESCARYGFSVTSCLSGLFNKVCPYNDKFYDKCCETAYKYTASECPSPKKLSSDTCGGKYKCSCDPTDYPYASCNAPQIKGETCSDDNGTHYSSCACPEGVPAEHGCQSYYATPCGSICQVAYSDNCRNRTAVQTPYGCEKYFDDCSSKCEKAYPNNCHNRSAVSTPYGCEKYYADCSSKCEIAYPDNCRNRTAVISACPVNASCSYFSDCSSKIQSWSCQSGYKKSGNSCELNQAPLPILYGDGTVTKDILSDKTPIGIVFDETNKLALALTSIRSDGKPADPNDTEEYSTLKSAFGYNTKNGKMPVFTYSFYTQLLPSCGEDVETCSTDGRYNTDILLRHFRGGISVAAHAVNLYEPIGCNAAFCRKNQWFLPSAKELLSITKTKLDETLTLLTDNAAILSSCLSSTFISKNNIYEYGAFTQTNHYTSTHYFVRPVVCYGEVKQKSDVSVPCVLGALLGGDGKCYTTKLPSDVSAIGVVFDTDKRLAAALTDVKKDGTPGTQKMTWATTGNFDTPVVNCENYRNAEDDCGTDGRANTTNILKAAGGGTYEAAQAVNKYEPTGCVSAFCKKNKWFLPSYKEAKTLYNRRAYLDIARDLVPGLVISTMEPFETTFETLSKVKSYWTSTEKDKDEAYVSSPLLGGGSWMTKNSKNKNDRFVRPIIKY